jgi:hypothetical protein
MTTQRGMVYVLVDGRDRKVFVERVRSDRGGFPVDEYAARGRIHGWNIETTLSVAIEQQKLFSELAYEQMLRLWQTEATAVIRERSYVRACARIARTDGRGGLFWSEYRRLRRHDVRMRPREAAQKLLGDSLKWRAQMMGWDFADAIEVGGAFYFVRIVDDEADSEHDYSARSFAHRYRAAAFDWLQQRCYVASGETEYTAAASLMNIMHAKNGETGEKATSNLQVVLRAHHRKGGSRPTPAEPRPPE